MDPGTTYEYNARYKCALAFRAFERRWTSQGMGAESVGRGTHPPSREISEGRPPKLGYFSNLLL